MKKIYILPILIILLFLNCEKVVDIDVPSIEPKLVIDASFKVFFEENPVVAQNIVKLSLSADYFNDSIPAVTNATVFLTNLSDDTIINFFDNNLDGNYNTVNSFIPADDVPYELTVIYDNEIYKGKATKIKTNPIINVVQGDETLFSGEETELKITFKDEPIIENYYLFNFESNFFSTIDDRFFDGSIYNFSFFYQEDDIELPATVNIRISGISKEFYTYFEVLSSQSGQGGGGPFQSIPASLLGNIINTTNETNFPLGYFHISETDIFTIDLVEKD
jgi:hypothetical protein